MANIQKIQQTKKIRRKARVRSKISGTKERPRLVVHRSLNHVYAQIIDDSAGKTLVSASDLEVKSAKGKKKAELAFAVGEIIGQKALTVKIETVVFDRSSYQFQGRIKALADGAKKSGLKF